MIQSFAAALAMKRTVRTVGAASEVLLAAEGHDRLPYRGRERCGADVIRHSTITFAASRFLQTKLFFARQADVDLFLAPTFAGRRRRDLSTFQHRCNNSDERFAILADAFVRRLSIVHRIRALHTP